MNLVFATHNKNKLNEVRSLVPQKIKLVSLEEIECYDDIPETEGTLEGNAFLKANFVKKNYALNCFADDTGLEVEALGGAPGVLSARYSGKLRDAEDNMKKLLFEMRNISNRSAQFRTAIVLLIDNEELLFEGIINGHITTEPRGKGGFGYDPIFIPEGYNKTFAELPLVVKNTVGHRGKAILKLIDHLKKLYA